MGFQRWRCRSPGCRLGWSFCPFVRVVWSGIYGLLVGIVGGCWLGHESSEYSMSVLLQDVYSGFQVVRQTEMTLADSHSCFTFDVCFFYLPTTYYDLYFPMVFIVICI